jgi:hypothetical protein
MRKGRLPTYACAALIDPNGRVLLTGVHDFWSKKPYVQISREAYIPKGQGADDELERELTHTMGISLYKENKFFYLDRHEKTTVSEIGLKRHVVLLTYKMTKGVSLEIYSSLIDYARFMTIEQLNDALVKNSIGITSQSAEMVCRLNILKNENKI